MALINLPFTASHARRAATLIMDTSLLRSRVPREVLVGSQLEDGGVHGKRKRDICFTMNTSRPLDTR